jgi:hypothetical protein
MVLRMMVRFWSGAGLRGKLSRSKEHQDDTAPDAGCIRRFLVGPLQTRAHEGHDHKVLGTVTMAAADHVMLKDKDSKPCESVRDRSVRPIHFFIIPSIIIC